MRNTDDTERRVVAAAAYVMVSPLSDTTKLLRVKNERISPAI